MSEQDSTIRPEDEDVEAHKARNKFATEEATDKESESDDDVELHGKPRAKS